MSKPDFTEAVDHVSTQDPRYHREAYFFLRDALTHTVKQGKKARDSESGEHVSGQQLLDGIRQYALKQFGPMVVTVFDFWGIRSCQDFGEMVYNLIGARVFGKTDGDSIEHFKEGYTFKEAFVDPFLPAKRPAHRRVRTPRPAKELS
jgi:uncharacterized repeat protein (TIGR04138 family)